MTITNSDTNINQPIFNEMTKSVYDAQTNINPDEFYFVDPQFTGNKLLVSDGNGDIVEGTFGNGIAVDNGTINTNFYYGTCSTSASTQTKVVDCPNFKLEEGVNLRVKFANAQTYNGQAKLNVNNTGAVGVCRYGTTSSPRYCWYTGEVVDFVYDGTNFVLVEGGIATTSYYGVTQLQNHASSTSTSTALVPAALNNALQNIVTGAATYSTTGTYAVGDYCRYTSSGATYLYKCKTAITYDGTNSHAWNASEWDIVDDLFTQINNLATVAKTGSYNDLTDKPYIPAGVVVDQTYDPTSANAQSGVAIAGELADYTKTSGLATVATSGSYNDLSNKPTIPTALSSFTDDLGTNPTHTHSQYLTQHQDISGKANTDLSNLTDTGRRKFRYSNIKIVGDLDISEDFIISGFSSSNYAILPETFNPGNKAWRIQIKFKLTDISSDQYLLCTNEIYKGVTLFYYATTGTICSNISTNGTSWNISLRSTTPIVANTNYWVSLSFDTANYKIAVSTNGGNPDAEDTYVSSTPIVSGKYHLGVCYRNHLSLGPLTNGSIDLANSNIATGTTIFSMDYFWNGRKMISVLDELSTAPIISAKGSGWGMPSNTRMSLSIGTSGTSYTAPANGWFALNCWTTSTAASWANLANASAGIADIRVPNQGAAYQQRLYVPAKRGDIIQLAYNNLNTGNSTFQFIYAEGTI